MTTFFLRRGALAIGGAALLLSATIGFTQAQTATPTVATGARQQHAAVINLAATKLGLTGDQLSSALKDARKDLGVRQGNPQVGKLIHKELAVAAAAIGLPDVKTLRAALAGSTLADVALQHHVDAATVAAAIKSDVEAQIQALVTAGKLTAARGAALKLKADTKVDAFMKHQFKARGSSASQAG